MTRVCRLAVVLLAALGVACGGAPTTDADEPDTSVEGVPVPPGAERVLKADRAGGRIAVCAEMPGGPVEQGARQVPRTTLWIIEDGQARQIESGDLPCDPAWSHDGERLAYSAVDGIWVTGLGRGSARRLEDAPDEGPTEFGATSYAEPKWSPGDGRIAYRASNGGTAWIEVIDSGRGRRVYKSDPEAYEFAWGSNANTIVIGGTSVTLQ